MTAPATRSDRFFWGLIIAVGVIVAVWAAWSALRKDESEPVRQIVDFQFIERSGITVTKADLEGKVWIAGCVFTCCKESCPQISASMAELQRQLRSPYIRLVSFSVDPNRDQPDVLKKYADALKADPKRWLFLTGEQDAVYQFLEASFQTRPVEDKRVPDGFQIAHSNRLYLVDRQGRLRDSYRIVQQRVGSTGELTDIFEIDEEQLQNLRKDAEELAEGRFIPLSSLPIINATLNGTSAILLIVGWIFIRKRKVKPHVACMLSAVVVQTLFLGSYLYYHFHHGSTQFAGEGWTRPLYFSLLLSHTILAVVIVPLVILSLLWTVRGRFDRHKRIARWTLPLWLYVCVTGVLVYLFLYQWFAG